MKHNKFQGGNKWQRKTLQQLNLIPARAVGGRVFQEQKSAHFGVETESKDAADRGGSSGDGACRILSTLLAGSSPLSSPWTFTSFRAGTGLSIAQSNFPCKIYATCCWAAPRLPDSPAWDDGAPAGAGGRPDPSVPGAAPLAAHGCSREAAPLPAAAPCCPPLSPNVASADVGQVTAGEKGEKWGESAHAAPGTRRECSWFGGRQGCRPLQGAAMGTRPQGGRTWQGVTNFLARSLRDRLSTRTCLGGRVSRAHPRAGGVERKRLDGPHGGAGPREVGLEM